MTFVDKGIWGTNSTRMPYGEVSGIQKTTCCCFSAVTTSVRPICPKFGCDGAYVEEIKNDLQSRVNARGDTGIIRINEEQLVLLKNIDQKLDYVTSKLNENSTMKR